MRKAEISISSGNITGADPTHIPLSDLIGGFDAETNLSIPEPDLNSDDSDSETRDVRYKFPSQKKAIFLIADLVWAKVKNHPWWPGLLIDSSHASKAAMEYYKNDSHLVAFFGDKTFAWCKDYQLKPFLENFSEYKNQSKSEIFNKAIESALVEVSRRFAYSIFCPCLNRKLLIKPSYPHIESHGVKEGLGHYPTDTGRIKKYFSPKGLTGFIKTLALVPCEQNLDELGLVMSRAQITAFNVFREARNNSTSHKDLTVSTNFRKRNRPSTVRIEETDTVCSISNGSKSNNRPEKPKKEKDSDSLTHKKQKLTAQNEANTSTQEPIHRPVIIPSKEKKSDESDPTGLQLIFGTKSGTVPSETDLIRKFSRFGALKGGEMEREMEGSEIKIKICFKKRADAEMAFLGLVRGNLFGPELISYKLVYVSEMERKSKVQNGDDQTKLKKYSGTNDANVQSSSISATTTGQDGDIEMFADLSSNTQPDSLVNPNPNPNSNPESTTQAGDTFVNPNPSPGRSIQSDDTSVNPNSNPNPSLKPNSPSTIQVVETLVNRNPNCIPSSPDPNPSNSIQAGERPVNPNPNPSSTSDTLVNLELNPNPDSNPNASPNPKGSMNIGSYSPILSSVWQFVEKLEVFSHLPQKPHFMKLQSEAFRESKAMGLMVAYADLVESLPKLSLDDDMTVFKGKLANLAELEDNGFVVDPIRTRLTELIQIKTEVDEDKSKRAELERERAGIVKEEEDRQLVIEELDREMKECEEGLKELSEVCDELTRERDECSKEIEANTARIKEELCRLKKLDAMLRQKFERARNDD